MQEILSGVTPDEPNKTTQLLEFRAFYVETVLKPAMMEYYLRKEVEKLNKFQPAIQCAPTFICHSHTELMAAYHRILTEGYEGIVIRGSFGGVWKMKPFKDKEFLCTGVTEGKGKRLGHVGKFHFKTEDGKPFNCGGGRISYAELRAYFLNPPTGKMCTLRYHSTSDAGIPLCAQFIGVRNYD